MYHKAIVSLLILISSLKEYQAQYNVTLTSVSDPSINNWVLSTGKSTVYTSSLTNINKIQYSASYVYVAASGIPTYTIGPWPNNPNTAKDQAASYIIPRYPAANTGTRTSIPLGRIGIWTNGVGIFNANDGQSISGWSRNAYYFESSSFDSCQGHPENSGV